MESRAPSFPDGWLLPERPVVAIGEAEADSTHLLDGVSGGVLLDDGRIVIANRLAPMLRWYDRNGRLRAGIGRAGGGPGEFGGEGLGVHGLWRMKGDSVAAWDLLPRRMQVFSPSGVFVRAFTLAPPPGLDRFFAPRIIGLLGDSLLIASYDALLAPPAGGSTWRDSTLFATWSLTGEYGREVARAPGTLTYTPAFQQRVRGTQATSPRGAQPAGARRAPPPPPGPPPPFFARASLAATGRTQLYLSDGETVPIRVIDSAGRTILLVRPGMARQAVTAAMKAAYVHEMIEQTGGNTLLRQDLQRWLAAAIYPDSLPAYRRILVADDNTLWLQHFEPPNAPALVWSIIGTDGAWLTDLALRSGIRILDVRGDRVLAVATGDLDVQSVRVYVLLK